MNGSVYILILFLVSCVGFFTPGADASEIWMAPFDTTGSVSGIPDSALTLSDVLGLVASKNPTLRALALQKHASYNRLKQAGLWTNPELETEFENVGWDEPGVNGSDITILLSQEFEFFGQRGARKQVARAAIDATELQTRLSAYDLYLETKRRFYDLAHIQQRLELSRISLALTKSIVENIRFKIDKGAALQSELLLAQLEEQRAQLTLDQTQQEMQVKKTMLAALWNNDSGRVSFAVQTDSEPDFASLLQRISQIGDMIDSTRTLMQLNQQTVLLRAERSLAVAEARPSVKLSGGYRRIGADDSNTLLFGIALPLPILNRNQGTTERLEAELRSLSYAADRARLETVAGIEASISMIRQLNQKHLTFNSVLLPTAEKVYETLHRAYEAGRVPYTQLLDAERSLSELRFEHNDMILEIYQQIIALEALTGITLRTDKEF